MNTTEKPHSAEPPTVDIVEEQGSRPAGYEFPSAGSADIVRAAQKDAFYQQRVASELSTIVQELWGTRQQMAHQGAIRAASSLLYHVQTTLRGAQTLGEEYCGILQTSDHRAVAWPRRLLLVLLQTLSEESVLVRVISRVCARLGVRVNGRKVIGALGMTHLAVFYLSGVYYEVAKRLARVRYVFMRRRREGEVQGGYEVLGALLVLQMAVRAALAVRAWIGASGKKEKTWAVSEEEEEMEEEEDEVEACWADAPMDEKQSLEETNEVRRVTASSQHPCTLCLEPLRHAASTPCGHIFCWTCVFSWSQTHGDCPLCRQPLRTSHILALYNY